MKLYIIIILLLLLHVNSMLTWCWLFHYCVAKCPWSRRDHVNPFCITKKGKKFIFIFFLYFFCITKKGKKFIFIFILYFLKPCRMGWWDYICFGMFLNVKNTKEITQIVWWNRMFDSILCVMFKLQDITNYLVKSYLVIILGSIVRNVVRGTLTH
jgi:hypothetical protein